MGIDDALNKAKSFAQDNPEKADQAFDSATEKVTDRTPDQFDEHVTKGSDAARDHLGLGGKDDEKQN